jgi:outer membrane protein assembly factor BamB
VPSDTRPVAFLTAMSHGDPAWTLAVAGPASVLLSDGTTKPGVARLAALGLTAGDAPQPLLLDAELAVGPLVFAAGGAFVANRGAVLQAFDARDGRTWWRRRLETDASIVATTTSRIAVLAGGRLVGLDVASGATAWSVDVPAEYARERSWRPSRAAWASASRLYFSASTELVGMDAATGATLFAQPSPLPPDCRGDLPIVPRFAVDERRLMAMCGDWTVEDARTGAVLVRHKALAGVSPGALATIRGDTLYAVADDGTLVAADLETGAIKWRAALRVLELQTASADVFVCTRGGVLHALSPATGESRWSFGVGTCSGYPSLSSFKVVEQAPGGPAIAASVDGSGVTTFARADRARPAAVWRVRGTARVDGRRAPGIRVWVGDDRVTTDGAGNWVAAVTRGGVARIEIDEDSVERIGARRCTRSDVRFAAPAADGSAVEVAVTAHAGPCDDDGR